jgi:alkyl hydroperoxide reductase subunit AhpC
LRGEERKQVQILAVSIDTHEDSMRLVKELKNRFQGEFDIPLLEDKDHKVIDRYGILSPHGNGWPHPATYVVDRAGVVRWKFVEVDYRERASNEQILRALRNIPE